MTTATLQSGKFLATRHGRRIRRPVIGRSTSADVLSVPVTEANLATLAFLTPGERQALNDNLRVAQELYAVAVKRRKGEAITDTAPIETRAVVEEPLTVETADETDREPEMKSGPPETEAPAKPKTQRKIAKGKKSKKDGKKQEPETAEAVQTVDPDDGGGAPDLSDAFLSALNPDA